MASEMVQQLKLLQVNPQNLRKGGRREVLHRVVLWVSVHPPTVIIIKDEQNRTSYTIR